MISFIGFARFSKQYRVHGLNGTLILLGRVGKCLMWLSLMKRSPRDVREATTEMDVNALLLKRSKVSRDSRPNVAGNWIGEGEI